MPCRDATCAASSCIIFTVLTYDIYDKFSNITQATSQSFHQNECMAAYMPLTKKTGWLESKLPLLVAGHLVLPSPNQGYTPESGESRTENEASCVNLRRTVYLFYCLSASRTYTLFACMHSLPHANVLCHSKLWEKKNKKTEEQTNMNRGKGHHYSFCAVTQWETGVYMPREMSEVAKRSSI